MILKYRRKTPPGRTGLIIRLAVIVVLVGCAWFVWFNDPFDPDKRRAARFCAEVQPEAPTAVIMQMATERGATAFATPQPGVLDVSFWKSVCSIETGNGPRRAR